MAQLIFDQHRLKILNQLLCNKVEPLFSELGVDVVRGNKLYYGSCCVHGGDNPSALNVYPSGHTAPGFWQCNTQKCQNFFKRNLIGFVRGVLSHQKYDWTSPRDKFVFSFDKTIHWCCDFVGQKLKDIELKDDDIEKSNFCAQVNILNRNLYATSRLKEITREIVRGKLEYPASYFIQRGYDPCILNKYDVGICKDPRKPMHNRAVAPIYDENYTYVVGCTGRSLYQECAECGLYHSPCLNCKDIVAPQFFSKWANNPGFSRNAVLYNMWFAKDEIERTGKVILVEGPGDVWKLEMAGVRNAVALLGSSLTDGQQIILEKTYITDLIVLADNDEAGNALRDDVYKKLRRIYKLRFPEFVGHDVGGLTPTEILELGL